MNTRFTAQQTRNTCLVILVKKTRKQQVKVVKNQSDLIMDIEPQHKYIAESGTPTYISKGLTRSGDFGLVFGKEKNKPFMIFETEELMNEQFNTLTHGMDLDTKHYKKEF